MIISYMACLCRTGVKFELIRLNKIRDYSLKSNHQEMQLFKVATSFGLCLKVLHFQEQPFKQLQYFEKKLPISFSHTLDDLHTLDKFSFTFRSSRSHIISKIGLLKFQQYSQENTCIGVSCIGPQPCNFIKETPTQVFSCEYCTISRNSFLYGAPLLLYFEQLHR